MTIDDDVGNNVNCFDLFREALQKSGVNIKPILLRLKDRQKSVIDRN